MKYVEVFPFRLSSISVCRAPEHQRPHLGKTVLILADSLTKLVPAGWLKSNVESHERVLLCCSSKVTARWPASQARPGPACAVPKSQLDPVQQSVGCACRANLKNLARREAAGRPFQLRTTCAADSVPGRMAKPLPPRAVAQFVAEAWVRPDISAGTRQNKKKHPSNTTCQVY
jgi:hypothetical protein